MPAKFVDELIDKGKVLLNKIRGFISPLNGRVPVKVNLALFPTVLFDLWSNNPELNGLILFSALNDTELTKYTKSFE